MKIKLKLVTDNGTLTVVTSHNGFKFNEIGVSFVNPELGFQQTVPYSELKSFSLEGSTDDEDRQRSADYQELKSDKSDYNKKTQTSGQWTV